MSVEPIPWQPRGQAHRRNDFRAESPVDDEWYMAPAVRRPGWSVDLDPALALPGSPDPVHHKLARSPDILSAISAISAISAVAAGEAVYGAAVARRIVEFFTGAPARVRDEGVPRTYRREREVLELVAAGLGNDEIARRLVLSEKTIRNDVSAIMTKLHTRDRASMVAKARDAGIGGTSPG